LIMLVLRTKPKGASHGKISDRAPGLLHSVLLMVWATAVAIEKRIKLSAAHRGATRGLVVLTDRYPQNEILGFNEGPLMSRLTRVPLWLHRFEATAYSLAHRLPPDLVIKLIVTPETAARREPDMDPAVIRTRIAAVPRLAFPGARVVCIDAEQSLTDVIRAVTPDRIIIADGNKIGNQVTPELKDLDIAQGCRGYFPSSISHYKAPWANKDPERCPTPVWPGTMNGEKFDKTRLETFYKPWIELTTSGIGVHCGECGCWNKTPHDVFLAWFQDVLDILTTNKIGYALWNFKGDFGILNSGRQDVAYQDWYGNKLDKGLLELLKKH